MRGGFRTTLLGVVVAAGLIGGPAATTAGAQEPVPAPPAPPSLPETLVPSWNECFQGLAFPGPSGEIYGPTDINAMSANGSMAVATDDQGTVTVLRYPRPSYYDQVKYRTSSRDEDRFGALENEGAFLGVLVPDQGVTWLRDQPVAQTYTSETSDTVAQTYTLADLGVEVTVTDTVAADRDAFERAVDVTVTDSTVVPDELQVVAYENLNLTVSRIPYFPVMDWCTDELNADTATYDGDADAIVHEVSGTDLAAGEQRSVAMAVGFDRASAGHQVGGDAFEGTSAPADPPLPTQDAYLDAADGTLSGNGTYTGQTTGALTAPLDLADGDDQVRLVMAGGTDAAAAVGTLQAQRGTTASQVVDAKQAWFDQLLADAPMPGTDDPDVLAVARRALVSLASVYDPESGAIVASIATQSPYGEDWPRDGAFFNHVLDLIGQHDWVAKRLQWYADLQSDGQPGPTADGLLQPATIPDGNWAMNYYADGVVGGPIPWEIDETGYMLWAFWDHVEATGDTTVLEDVYPAVQKAANFLTECTDATGNGLQCTAFEDDNPQPRQTIHGAGPVWLGLDSAVKAAEALGETADADTWAARRDELGAAIDEQLYSDGVYGGGNGVIVWPVCFKAYDDPRFTEDHYDAIWDRLTPTFAQPEAGTEGKVRGLYESKGLLALAKATRDLPGWNDRVRSGLRWVATQHAEPDTRVMGEEWLYRDGEVVSGVSQPHVWEQVLFYLAALEAWPPADVDVTDTRDCAGVIGRLRTADTDAGSPVPGPDPAPTPDDAGDDAPVSGRDPDGRRALPATGGGSLALLGVGLVTLARRTRRR